MPSNDLETLIDQLEIEKQSLERQLADAWRRNDYKGGERLSRRLKLAESRIEKLYEDL